MKTINLKPRTKKKLKELLKFLAEDFNKNNKHNMIKDLSDIDTGLITNMSYLFYDRLFCSIQNSFFDGVGKWDTSKVLKMDYMFKDCWKFNQKLDFDTSKVRDFSWMFCNCYNFNQALNFNTKNAKDMSGMFFKCYCFNQALNFDTSNVTDMASMFCVCHSLNKPIKFNTKNVESMAYMFFHCKKFNKPLSFDTANVKICHICYTSAKSLIKN